MQLEAKESTQKQALLKLQQYEEREDELCSMLMKSELERDEYNEKCRDARNRADELESRVKEMPDLVSDIAKICEHLLHVLNELKETRVELLVRGTELAAARDLELNALTQATMMETSVTMERQKVE